LYHVVNSVCEKYEFSEMSISFQLDDEQSARLEELARVLGVDARELAKAAVDDLLTRSTEDFERAAKYVLEKNRELYRRLS
jgi:antitoxin FitA